MNSWDKVAPWRSRAYQVWLIALQTNDDERHVDIEASIYYMCIIIYTSAQLSAQRVSYTTPTCVYMRARTHAVCTFRAQLLGIFRLYTIYTHMREGIVVYWEAGSFGVGYCESFFFYSFVTAFRLFSYVLFVIDDCDNWFAVNWCIFMQLNSRDFLGECFRNLVKFYLIHWNPKKTAEYSPKHINCLQVLPYTPAPSFHYLSSNILSQLYSN